MLGKDTILQYLHVRNTIDCSTMPYSNTDGQTGSGKSFSMVGSASDKGIIPRVCHALFHMIDDERRLRGDALFKVEASYLEIYNEVLVLYFYIQYVTFDAICRKCVICWMPRKLICEFVSTRLWEFLWKILASAQSRVIAMSRISLRWDCSREPLPPRI